MHFFLSVFNPFFMQGAYCCKGAALRPKAMLAMREQPICFEIVQDLFIDSQLYNL